VGKGRGANCLDVAVPQVLYYCNNGEDESETQQKSVSGDIPSAKIREAKTHGPYLKCTSDVIRS